MAAAEAVVEGRGGGASTALALAGASVEPRLERTTDVTTAETTTRAAAAARGAKLCGRGVGAVDVVGGSKLVATDWTGWSGTAGVGGRDKSGNGSRVDEGGARGTRPAAGTRT